MCLVYINKKYTTRRFQNVGIFFGTKTMFNHFALIYQFSERVRVDYIFLDEYENINMWYNQET